MLTVTRTIETQLPLPSRTLLEREFRESIFAGLFPSLRRAYGNPAFINDYANQIKYLWHYLTELGCTHFVEESHYYDRDFLEDFGAIYSKTISGTENHCRRIHFFSGKLRGLRIGGDTHVAQLRDRIQKADADKREREFDAAAQELQRGYLGFLVLRPLPRSPIGRTVLRPYSRKPRTKSDKSKRPVLRLRASSEYRIHYAGFPLVARGVAFQQQDRGTAACATIAIWSVLHSLGRRSIPPVQITRMANRFESPFGRILPSEALGIRQIMDAFRGANFECFQHEHAGISTTLAYLHLAVRSRMPIVAVGAIDTTDQLHAVAVLGGRERLLNQGITPQSFDTGSRASLLKSLYVHDDRLGPYVRADVVLKKGRVGLSLQRRWDDERSIIWITDLIFPLSPEIRTSFPMLLRATAEILPWVQWWFRLHHPENRETQSSHVMYDLRLVRSAEYSRQLVIEDECDTDTVRAAADRMMLSRTAAVARIFWGEEPLIDILHDTTGTELHRTEPLVIPVGTDKVVCGELADFIRTKVFSGELEQRRLELESQVRKSKQVGQKIRSRSG